LIEPIPPEILDFLNDGPKKKIFSAVNPKQEKPKVKAEFPMGTFEEKFFVFLDEKEKPCYCPSI
jgi:hypothetical protein